MLMKKRFFFGLIAVALIALNALAFSSFAALPGTGPGIVPGPGDLACYQTLAKCGDKPGLREVCTRMKTNENCKRFYCSDCIKHEDPSWPWMTHDEYTLLPELDIP